MITCYVVALPAQSIKDTEALLDYLVSGSAIDIPMCRIGLYTDPDVQQIIAWFGECNPIIDEWMIKRFPFSTRFDIIAFLKNNKFNRIHIIRQCE